MARRITGRESIKIDIPENGILDNKTIMNIISYHKSNVLPRLETLNRYYEGDHDINYRILEDGKPNNQIIDNYPAYITDFQVGYLLGEKISYNCKDTKFIKEIERLYSTIEEQSHTQELGTDVSIYGYGYEMACIGLDNKGNKIEELIVLDPRETILIYDTQKAAKEKPIACITYIEYKDHKTGNNVYEVEYINKTEIRKYKSNSSGELEQLKKVIKHPFKDIPVIEYKNNSKRIGDFENEVGLIDSYNLVISDDVNDVEYTNDAYICFYGVEDIDNEDDEETSTVDILKRKAMFLPEGSKAEWLLKNINDTHRENIKKDISNNIHKFSKTPDLTDEKFSGNTSGVAMHFKILGTEQKAVRKEACFRKSLKRRIDILSNSNNKLSTKQNIEIVFSRNLPINITEIGDFVTKLKGNISDETLYSQIPFIGNAEEEKQRVKKEKEEYQNDLDLDLMQRNNQFDYEEIKNKEDIKEDPKKDPEDPKDIKEDPEGIKDPKGNKKGLNNG